LPRVKGTYQWVASYSGDADNNGAATFRGRTNEFVIGPGITVLGKALFLVGGLGNDAVSVAPLGISPTGSTGIKINALLNGVTFKNQTYTQHFASVFVVGLGGNDFIQFAKTLTIPTVIDEGGGNDTILAGGGTNTITAGAVGSTAWRVVQRFLPRRPARQRLVSPRSRPSLASRFAEEMTGNETGQLCFLVACSALKGDNHTKTHVRRPRP
jgi:hypothetical protein